MTPAPRARDGGRPLHDRARPPVSDRRDPGTAVLLAILTGHLLLVASVSPPLSLLLSEPVWNGDYGVHHAEAGRVAVHLSRAGALWGWSPRWMAGFPEGL